MPKQNLITYRQLDEYQSLVEECQSIITEGAWNFRTERILTYGKLGERIVKDALYKKFSKGNVGFLEAIAEDIGISYSDICRSIQFYEKFKIVSPTSEGWDKFKEGKNISWSKIKTYYLPEEARKECKHSFDEVKAWRCRMCKKVSWTEPDEK